jgi:hypothetical protein
MKKSIKLLLLFFVFATAFLCGCSEEIYDEHGHEHGINKNKITLNQFKNETKIKDFSPYFKTQLSGDNSVNRTAELSEFIIDTVAILRHISSDNKTTYSFRVYSVSDILNQIEKYNLIYRKENNIWEKSIVAFKEINGASQSDLQFEDIENLYDSKLVETESITITELCFSELFYVECDGSCAREGKSTCDGFNCPTGQCVKYTITVQPCGSSGAGPSDPNGNGSTNPIQSGYMPLNP